MTSISKNSGVSGHFVIGQLKGAIQKGFDPKVLLRKADIDETVLSNPGIRVSFEEFATLMRISWEDMQDESAGYTTPPLMPGSFGMMCHATITCPNLRRALLRGARCFSLFGAGLRFELIERGPEAEFNILFDSNLDDDYFAGCTALIWIRWASWMIDKKILLGRMNFHFPEPPFSSEYENIFSGPVYYQQETSGFVIPSRYLDMPLVQTPQSLNDFLANTPRNLLTDYQKDDSLSGQIRRLLHRQLSLQCGTQETLNLEDTAKQLHMTSQTLRRHLREEGNSFQDIKDSVRKDTARHHLLHTDASINEIATIMGFSEPSVFHRAFKKWTGFTPGAYREQHPSHYR